MTAAIQLEAVSKQFRIYHERPSTLQERLVRRRSARFEEFWALRDVSAEIQTGETVGVLGANGSGKSTLLKTVAGILKPTTGRVTRSGRLAALLELGAGFHPELTGRENVFLNASILGLSRRETERNFDDIVEFSGLHRFIDNQVKHYSSGMHVRLGFAVAVHVDPEILLVDEVLAVGDEAFQRKCLERVRTFQREGRTILFVTHAAELVRQICDRAIVLDHGEVVADDEPTAAIRGFRGAVHGDPAEDVESEEHGTRDATISKVHLRRPDGSVAGTVSSGDELIIDVDLIAHTRLAEAVVGFAIHDERDQLLFGMNSLDLGRSIVDWSGPLSVRFRLRSLPLIDGRYAVSVAVHSPDGQIDYHWIDRCGTFTVLGTGRPGAVHVETSCELSEGLSMESMMTGEA